MKRSQPDDEGSAELDAWNEALFLSDFPFTRNEMNSLIHNYLIVEGYKEAALKFEKEAGVLSNTDLTSSLDVRLHIREAIEHGNISDAIHLINDSFPELLDDNPILLIAYFKLQQQSLIEMIRQGDVDGALDFAQTHLAERGEEDMTVLDELERAMALLAYEHPEKSPFAELLEPAHRQRVASDVNGCILESESQPRSSRLDGLMRTLFWCQRKLDSAGCKYPKLIDIPNAKITMSQPSPL